MQKAGLVDGEDIRLQCGNRLSVKQLARNAEFGQESLFLFGRLSSIAAPCLEPTGLANAASRTSLDDPLPMQRQRRADQAVQGSGTRQGARRCRAGQKAR